MGVLLLKLAGPLQAWGSDSRYTERKTQHELTKSGIIGLLAAALGRTREEPIDNLACLRVAVRTDQPGSLVKDYQTSHPRRYNKKTNQWDLKEPHVTTRHYLEDAVFVAAVEVPDGRVEEYAEALIKPKFPLYLGRRSCPPACKILLATRKDVGLQEALAQQPWEAHARKLIYSCRKNQTVDLDVARDVLPADDATLFDDIHDTPISFSQEFRQYAWRRVAYEKVSVPNPHFIDTDHDPFAAL